MLQRFYISETINNYLLDKNEKKIEYIKSNKLKYIKNYIYNIYGTYKTDSIDNGKDDIK